MLGADAVLVVPLQPRLLPVVVPLLVVAGLDEELHLHLLELARAEQEVAGRDLVAERLADLRDAERHLLARRVEHVEEVDEDPLRRFRPHEDDVRGVLHRAHERLEHEVELARLGQLAAALARTLRRLLRAARVHDLVGAKALLALLAVDQRVGEAGDVSRGFPHPRVHQDGAIDADDVRARQHHVAPPGVLDVALQLDADRPVVPAARQAPVNLARLKGKPAPFGEVHDLLHCHCTTHRPVDVSCRRRGGKLGRAVCCRRTRKASADGLAKAAGGDAGWSLLVRVGHSAGDAHRLHGLRLIVGAALCQGLCKVSLGGGIVRFDLEGTTQQPLGCRRVTAEEARRLQRAWRPWRQVRPRHPVPAPASCRVRGAAGGT